MITSFKTLVEAANREVDVMEPDQAQALSGDPSVQFIDVRETGEWQQATIPGALHLPRGLLEFMADPESPMHKADLDPDKKLVVFCASGGRSALAAKTLKDMGYTDVANMTGGFNAWSQAGKPATKP
ncbi:MAG: rhodanese-like domain-containing protein [Geminicoccaceae bacterium]